jgi:phage baseplate assembly protein W
MPLTLPEDYTGMNEFGANWRVQFADADGIPLNMVSFEVIDFGAISYKEIFQNVKTILATPLFSAALERTLGIDQRIVDLPIDRASEATIAILDALTYWEPRVEVMNIDFDYADALNGHLGVNLQLKIKNVIYGTNKPYEATNISAPPPEKVTQALPPMNVPVPGPPGPQGPAGPLIDPLTCSQIYIGDKARLVAMANGVRLEVQDSTGNWITQTEWTQA